MPAYREHEWLDAPATVPHSMISDPGIQALFDRPDVEQLRAKRDSIDAIARGEADEGGRMHGPWFETALLRQGEARGALAVGWVRIINYRRQPVGISPEAAALPQEDRPGVSYCSMRR